VKLKNVIAIAVLTGTIYSCSGNDPTEQETTSDLYADPLMFNSCYDLIGVVTHSDIEITGIKSVSLTTISLSNQELNNFEPLEVTDFSNLQILLEMSWIEEQHRLSAPSTIIQSMVNWFISPAAACSLVPRYEEFQPKIVSIEIYSETDFNETLIAGSNLAEFFHFTPLDLFEDRSVSAPSENSISTARSYRINPAWKNGTLIASPDTPKTHVFNITVILDNGHIYEARSPEFLISGK